MGAWDAEPSEALWYGEVIGSKPGEDVSYVDGYSSQEERPSIRELIPAGWKNTRSTVKPTPRNPKWKPSKADDN